jgi:hypothetical protein
MATVKSESRKQEQVAYRAVRAKHTADTVTVYQAYSPEIALPALKAGRFVPPFKIGRMTWIKPSFLWMAYRSGWATKTDQEHVLAIEITRAGFEWALAHSSLSHYEGSVDATQEEWERRKEASPVRIQWDPERDLDFRPLGYRSIQIGLSGESVARYVNDWIVSITDVTDMMRDVSLLVLEGKYKEATERLPHEEVYILPPDIKHIVGVSDEI